MLGEPVCFSFEADLVAGAVLIPVAGVALREVRCARELPFALLPTVFAAHQIIESLVWLGSEGKVSAGVSQAAALAYVLIALPLLPALVPTAVLLLEPHGARLRVAAFVVLGWLVALYLLVTVLAGPVTVITHEHALEYGVGLQHGALVVVLYVLAVVGPSVLSGYHSIVASGVLNLVGLSVVAVLYADAFASLWCVYAALTSALVVLHMYRRRTLPDPHRLHGHAAALPG